MKDKAFELFQSMKPGQLLVIKDTARKDPASFIQYGKDFIDEGYYNYEFTKDYKGFRRMYHTIQEFENKRIKNV